MFQRRVYKDSMYKFLSFILFVDSNKNFGQIKFEKKGCLSFTAGTTPQTTD